jgi:rhodanese-related sulfurtransferase
MIDQIAPSDFARWLADMAQQHPLERTVLLDVREPHEVQWASVGKDVAKQGCQLVTIPMAAIPVRLAELDPDQPIACLCHHGSRSMQVARFLVSNGFTEVANIAGGIDAWSVQLDPTVARY